MMSRWLAVSLLLLSFTALGCVDDSGPVEGQSPFAAPPPGEGFQMSFETIAPAGTEIWKCRVYDIPTDNWEPVNRVESFQNDGVHHMDIMALAFANVDLEPGVYDCDELYDAHSALMEEGVILFAAQSPEQVIQLPPGIVANLPQKLRVMHEIHYVNTSDQNVEVYSHVNAYTIHPNDVRDTIWGGAVRDVHLNIPPGSEHSEWTRCVMNQDIDLLLLSSHTHQLARKVTIRRFDGTDVGEEIYSNTDWQTPFLKDFGVTPLHVPAGEGFEFRCDFSNTGPTTVNWGFAAADEMCQMAMVFTPGEAARKCEQVASSDDVLN